MNLERWPVVFFSLEALGNSRRDEKKTENLGFVQKEGKGIQESCGGFGRAGETILKTSGLNQKGQIEN